MAESKQMTDRIRTFFGGMDLLFFQLQVIGDVGRCIRRPGGDTVRIAIRYGPRGVQIDQGLAGPGEIRRYGTRNDIVRPLTGDRSIPKRSCNCIVGGEFKQIP